jgi:protein O-mannosyl-transferase
MDTGKRVVSKWFVAAVILLPALVAVIVYSNSLHGGFVYDDRVLVTENSAVRDLSALGLHDIFTHQDYTKYSPHYLPIRVLSYALDYKYWKFNPFGFHLTNLLLQVTNVILVALVVMVIAGSGGAENGRVKWLAGGAAALLFTTHPLMSESVAWISGRKDLLSTGFSLGATLCYLKSFRRPLSKKTDWPIVGGLALFALAMMSKATAWALPAALLAFEIFLAPGEGRGKLRLRIERLVPFILVSILFVFIDMRLSAKSGMIASWFGGSLFTHMLTISTIPLLYIGKLVWPARLCVEYTPLVQKSLFGPLVLASLLFWAGVAVWFGKRGKSAPVIAALGAWFVMNLVPAMNLAPTGKLIADRYVYLPAIGLFGILGYMFARVAVIRGVAARVAACVLLIATAAGLGVRTVSRNSDWRSELTLWQSAEKVEPRNVNVTHGLGYAYYQMKDYGNAERYFRKTIEIDSKYKQAYLNLGFLVFYVNKNADEAISLFKKVLEIDPLDAHARVNLAYAYFGKNDYDMAFKEILRAVDTDPSDLSVVRRLIVMRKELARRGVSTEIPQRLLDKINGKKPDAK